MFHDRIVERPRPQLLSLDDPDHDQIGAALGARGGDPAADRGADLLGFSEMKVARELGTTRRWVSDRLDELGDELEQLALPR